MSIKKTKKEMKKWICILGKIKLINLIIGIMNLKEQEKKDRKKSKDHKELQMEIKIKEKLDYLKSLDKKARNNKN